MAGVLLALDLETVDQAVKLARVVKPYVAGFKVGLGLLHSEPDSIERVVEVGLPVFVDAKLHDIPAQVEQAAEKLGRRGARWVTAHLSGGTRMVEAAVTGLGKGSGGRAGILGVSILTSLDQSDLVAIGMNGPIEVAVQRLVRIAAGVPVEGVVCSVHEVSIARETAGDLLMVTPGIRPSAVESHDQKRTATVEAAVRAGADYLVVGRAVSSAADPAGVAAAIAEEVASNTVV
jgi:orotidine-5'-phosphate decarboxylase